MDSFKKPGKPGPKRKFTDFEKKEHRKKTKQKCARYIIHIEKYFDDFEKQRLQCSRKSISEFIGHLLNVHEQYCNLIHVKTIAVDRANENISTLEADNATPICCNKLINDCDVGNSPINDQRRKKDDETVATVTQSLDHLIEEDIKEMVMLMEAVTPTVCDDGTEKKNCGKRDSEEANDMTDVLGTRCSLFSLQYEANGSNSLVVFNGVIKQESKPEEGTPDTISVSGREGSKAPAVPRICEICNKHFKTEGGLSRHNTNAHTGEKKTDCQKKYKCVFCEKEFKLRSGLVNHENVHTNTRNFVCVYCGTTFVSRSDMCVHERRQHVKERSYSCAYCEKRYTSSCNLKRHESQHRIAMGDFHEGLLTCPICNKVFKNSERVRSHKRIVHREKTITCKYCSKKFATTAKLKRHELSHTGIKPYSCMYCKKGFNQPGNRKTHERTHTGEKPYVCVHCGMTFAHSVTLRIHEQKH